jgi:hypothetical protein
MNRCERVRKLRAPAKPSLGGCSVAQTAAAVSVLMAESSCKDLAGGQWLTHDNLLRWRHKTFADTVLNVGAPSEALEYDRRPISRASSTGAPPVGDSPRILGAVVTCLTCRSKSKKRVVDRRLRLWRAATPAGCTLASTRGIHTGLFRAFSLQLLAPARACQAEKSTTKVRALRARNRKARPSHSKTHHASFEVVDSQSPN